MTNSNEKCWKCGKCHGSNDGSGYQPCHNLKHRPEPAPPPPTYERPPIKFIGPEESKQIKELTLSKVLLSALLISVPILLWKLDAIILAFKS